MILNVFYSGDKLINKEVIKGGWFYCLSHFSILYNKSLHWDDALAQKWLFSSIP